MSQATDILNYYNLQDYMRKMGLFDTDIRFIKDIVNTKMSLIRYEGLPKDLTSEILESALMFNSHLCFYYDEGLEKVVLCKWIPSAMFNIYWKPEKVDLIALSGRHLRTNYPYEDIVLVRDNIMDITPFVYVNEYIKKIHELEKTLFNVLKVAQLPLLISGSKNQAIVLKKLADKILNIEPFVIGDRMTDANTIQGFNIAVPIAPSEIYDLKEKYRAECLQALGIYGDPDQKKERLLNSEVESKQDFANFTYQGCLDERKRFVDECNKRWNTSIKIIESYHEQKEDDLAFQEEQLKMQEKITGGTNNGISK